MSTRWPLHPTLDAVTARVIGKSAAGRAAYLQRISSAAGTAAARGRLSCANLAHVAAAGEADKDALKGARWPNLAIVTAYNDMLSAHQPYEIGRAHV